VRARAARSVPLVGPLFADRRRAFHAYDAWLAAEPARSFTARLLDGDHALLWEYVDRAQFTQLQKAFAETGTGAGRILFFLTAEIWLRQLLLGESRPEESDGS
jgi:hypothetical protein